jgi:hypothetical protein
VSYALRHPVLALRGYFSRDESFAIRHSATRLQRRLFAVDGTRNSRRLPLWAHVPAFIDHRHTESRLRFLGRRAFPDGADVVVRTRPAWDGDGDERRVDPLKRDIFKVGKP